jgi:uncharacterized protein (DUF1501 family)
MPRANPIKCCEDFHRSAMREAHREVGVSRRHFLRIGAGAGLTLYAAQALPLGRLLEGAEEAAAQAPEAPILVTVFLPGGLDLLDSLVPLDQYGAYREQRGVLAQSDVTTPKLKGTGLGIHPSLTKGDGEGIKGLFERGKLGFLPGIDYANPDLSHFHSRAFWETGLITPSSATGWLGRWLDANGGKDNPFQGVTSGHTLSPVLRSAGAPVSSIDGVRSSQLQMPRVGPKVLEAAMTAWTDLAFPRRKDPAGLAAARTAARYAQDVAVKLKSYQDLAPAQETEGGFVLPGVGPQTTTTGYPADSQFGDHLRQLAFLAAQPLGLRVATVDAHADFDTHAGQPGTLERILAEVSAGLAAFQNDIEARGLGDRVLTFVWSEFGRRPKGNESLGTDHGAGGIGWVQGTRAMSGLLTEYPSLRDLDAKQNLKVTVDFRQVYASLIEQWLGTDAGAVIPNAGAFSRVQLVR